MTLRLETVDFLEARQYNRITLNRAHWEKTFKTKGALIYEL